MNTQHQRIISYLRKHKKGITSLEAIEKIGTLNLPGRISELRSLGMKIKQRAIEVRNRYGKLIRINQYFMA